MNEINISKPTRAQIKKMSSGGSVIMKAGEHPVLVNPVNFKRMSKSFMKGKGCAMSMCKEEIEHNMKGGSLIGDLFNKGSHLLYESSKPYLKELATAGIMSTATALSAIQPELAPIIMTGGLGISALVGDAISNDGRIKTKPTIPIDYIPPSMQTYQQPVDTVYRSQIHSVPNLTGMGLGRHDNRAFCGGNLRYNGVHPALLQPNPTWLLNRNLIDSLNK